MTSHRPGFTGSPLDRADNLRLDAERIGALVRHPGARLLRLDGLDPVLDEGGRLLWSPLGGRSADELVFLGLQEEEPLFAPLARVEADPSFRSVFGLLASMEHSEAAVWAAARSLIVWHNRHGFCANCGAATRLFRAGWGRRCEACSADHFPRVDPVVIMLAEHGGEILLARQPQFPPRRYSALAGFIEPGESIEEAVAREFREEASLAVSEVRYIASQPWPFPSSLMIACLAEASGHDIVLDTTELEDAIWVDRAGVAAALSDDPRAPFQAPPPFAIAHTLLRHWLDASPRLAGAPLPA